MIIAVGPYRSGLRAGRDRFAQPAAWSGPGGEGARGRLRLSPGGTGTTIRLVWKVVKILWAPRTTGCAPGWYGFTTLVTS
jgi:hypothetical protein